MLGDSTASRAGGRGGNGRVNEPTLSKASAQPASVSSPTLSWVQEAPQKPQHSKPSTPRYGRHLVCIDPEPLNPPCEVTYRERDIHMSIAEDTAEMGRGHPSIVLFFLFARGGGSPIAAGSTHFPFPTSPSGLSPTEDRRLGSGSQAVGKCIWLART